MCHLYHVPLWFCQGGVGSTCISCRQICVWQPLIAPMNRERHWYIWMALPCHQLHSWFILSPWFGEEKDFDILIMTSISCIPNVCSYFVKLYCSSLDWFIARTICFFHFLPIFQDFNFEPSNTEVTLWNLSCFTFMILGFISSRWLQSFLKKGHPFAKHAFRWLLI